ncbi:MAG: tyrosine-type recombinase/integrase [Bacteroidia bacterium]|nr:tyrosine-type recombinase/integrase [Bacteroidia bacterium]MCX7763328.1 tyrosine-type recombinase/integrase [Bacteroidia bacterium]MDW8057107.1 tyrosine-type recombinase/integrase [Bacteroidia bacterium]
MENADSLHLSKDILTQWLHYLQIEKGLRPATLQAYLRDLMPLIGTPLRYNQIETKLALLSQANEWQSITLARKLSAVRSLLRFLYEMGYLAEDLSNFWENPRFWRKIPTYLTPEEARQMIENYPTDRRHGWRNRLLLELLYGAGLRVSEACNLRLEDINHQEEMLLIYGKGGKVRWVPYGRGIRTALEAYLPHRAKQATQNTTALLLSQKGGALTRIQAFTIVREAARLAGIERPISPHALRHSYATHLLLAGMDIAYLQQLLGHASLTTTQHYLQLLPRDLAQAVLQYHPLAKEVRE